MRDFWKEYYCGEEVVEDEEINWNEIERNIAENIKIAREKLNTEQGIRKQQESWNNMIEQVKKEKSFPKYLHDKAIETGDYKYFEVLLNLREKTAAEANRVLAELDEIEFYLEAIVEDRGWWE